MVTISSGRYRLNPSAKFSFDVWQFEALVRDAIASVGDLDRVEAYTAGRCLHGPLPRVHLNGPTAASAARDGTCGSSASCLPRVLTGSPAIVS
jgi:hypothetical protein